MSVEKNSTQQALEQNLALASGIDSESPTKISAAAYICSELDELPRLEDDFEFKMGYGISSDSIKLNLALLYDEIKQGKYDDLKEERMKGELLNQYDEELIDLALYLFKENNPNRQKTNAWKKQVNRLEEREEEFEELLDSIRKEFN